MAKTIPIILDTDIGDDIDDAGVIMKDKMSGRGRFDAVMSYKKPDRLPVWYFGYWRETIERWRGEGLADDSAIAAVTGMDDDWEAGMWGGHGLVNYYPIAPEGERMSEVVEETDETVTSRDIFGAVTQHSKKFSSLPHVITPGEMTREAWSTYKRFIDPDTPARRAAGWREKARALEARTHALSLYAGSLFGMTRNTLGLEGISYLCYDDPALYEEIIEHQADFFMRLNGPLLEECHFEIAYIFEDCCGKSGPLISPDTYKRYYDTHYRRLVEFYHAKGVRQVMLDSDGKIDDLLPLWLDSGIDVIFPIEVGSWRADPVALRKRFGRRLKMMGGVDKNLIPQGEAVVRAHLERLRPVVEEGGYVPLPDHRIPPDCSLSDFAAYVKVFKEVFGVEEVA